MASALGPKFEMYMPDVYPTILKLVDLNLEMTIADDS